MKRIAYIVLSLLAASCMNTVSEDGWNPVLADMQTCVTFSAVEGSPDVTKSSGTYSEAMEDTSFVVEYCDFDPLEQTKTEATTEAKLTKFYLNVTEGSETLVHTNSVMSGSVASSFKGDLYWPSTDKNWHFYASNVQMKGSSDYYLVDCNGGSDVIYAYNASPSYKSSNSLAFKHAYARLGTISVNGPSGVTVSLSEANASCPVSGTYDIKSDAWASTGSPQALTLSGTNDRYVVPGTYAMSVTYSISDGAVSQSGITRSGNVTLKQGKVNNIAITVDDCYTYDFSISPATDSILLGQASSYTARLVTSYGGSVVGDIDATSLAEWSSASPAIATVSGGTVTGQSIGSATISATYGTHYAVATAIVYDEVDYYDPPTGLTLSCSDIPASGGTVSKDNVTVSGSVTQTVHYKSGQSKTISVTPEYSSSDWSAAVSGSDLGTTATGRTKKGTITLTYHANGQPAQASCDVYQEENEIESSSYVISAISASPSVFTNTGGTSTISGGAGTRTDNYTSGHSTESSFTPNKSVTSPASISGNEVTIPENTGDTRTFTVTYSYDGAESKTCQITQEDTLLEIYDYSDVTVSISASPTEIGVTGGSSTLSWSASYKKRQQYSSGKWTDWETETGTPTISGSADGFTRSGNTVTAGTNTGEERSVTYYADFSIGGVSASQQSVTITQVGDSATYGNITLTVNSISDIPASGGTSAVPSFSYSQTVTYASGKASTVITSGATVYYGLASGPTSTSSSSATMYAASLATTEKARAQVGTAYIKVSLNGMTAEGSTAICQAANVRTQGTPSYGTATYGSEYNIGGTYYGTAFVGSKEVYSSVWGDWYDYGSTSWGSWSATGTSYGSKSYGTSSTVNSDWAVSISPTSWSPGKSAQSTSYSVSASHYTQTSTPWTRSVTTTYTRSGTQPTRRDWKEYWDRYWYTPWYQYMYRDYSRSASRTDTFTSGSKEVVNWTDSGTEYYRMASGNTKGSIYDSGTDVTDYDYSSRSVSESKTESSTDSGTDVGSKTQVPDSVTPTSNSTSWLTVSGGYVNVTANSGAVRSGTVTATNGTASASMSVTQVGITSTDQDVSYNETEESQYIDATAVNSSYWAKINGQTSSSASVSASAGSTTVTATAGHTTQPMQQKQVRTKYYTHDVIHWSDGSTTYSDEKGPYYTSWTNSGSPVTKGSSSAVTDGVSLSSSASWLATGGSYSANSSTSSRTATITAKNSSNTSAQATLTVTQAGKVSSLTLKWSDGTTGARSYYQSSYYKQDSYKVYYGTTDVTSSATMICTGIASSAVGGTVTITGVGSGTFKASYGGLTSNTLSVSASSEIDYVYLEDINILDISPSGVGGSMNPGSCDSKFYNNVSGQGFTFVGGTLDEIYYKFNFTLKAHLKTGSEKTVGVYWSENSVMRGDDFTITNSDLQPYGSGSQGGASVLGGYYFTFIMENTVN